MKSLAPLTSVGDGGASVRFVLPPLGSGLSTSRGATSAGDALYYEHAAGLFETMRNGSTSSSMSTAAPTFY